MAENTLSSTQVNFARFSIICLDIIKLPLIDILDLFISPLKLVNQIRRCQCLLAGDYRLNDSQLQKCCVRNPKNTPDYKTFDVSLLCKLISNLCPTRKPNNGLWKKITQQQLDDVHDAVEQIRRLRNEHFGHAKSANISDNDFQKLWKLAESTIKSCQCLTVPQGYTDYEEALKGVQRKKTWTFDEYTSCKERSRAIFISGNPDVLCGETACFKAETRIEQDVYLKVSWIRIDGPVKVDGSFSVDLNLKCDKYKGSDNTTLFIHNVCKEDEAGYKAVILGRDGIDINSNEIVLRTLGEPPNLKKLNVIANDKEVHICYAFEVSNHDPVVKEIKWSKDNLELDLSNAKYRRGGLKDSYIAILNAGEEDQGMYTCIVSNAAGSDSKQVLIDIPRAELPERKTVCCGLETTLDCTVAGNPRPDKVEWQESFDGETFKFIKNMNDKNRVISGDPCSPVLRLRNVSFKDPCYYRVMVSNVFGKYPSNSLLLQVTGDKPNITEGTCTLQGDSVKLKFEVFLYDDSPALDGVYWTKMTRDGKTGNLKSNIDYEVDTNDPHHPSLTIKNVKSEDAGFYRLIAANPVGETQSEAIVLDDPDVSLERYDEREDGGLCFTMKIKSVPVPNLVQWKIKENNSETIQPLDVNNVDFKGTSHSFPNPVLVVKHKTILENCSFELEVQNRIGRKTGEINQDIIKKDQETAGQFYANAGSNIQFGKLFVELAKKFPAEKIDLLKYHLQFSCNIEFDEDTATELEKATSAGHVFKILNKKEIFNPSDVIAMQFLLQETECEELEKKCVEYAKQKNAMYYYETPPEKGSRNVRFHVVAKLRHFTAEGETNIIRTVAEILNCSLDEVTVNGYLHATSFFIVLSIKEIYIEKLLAMKQHEKDKLMKLNIDYFKDDFHTVILERTAGVKDENTVMSLPNLTLNQNKLMAEKGKVTFVASVRECEEIVLLLSNEAVLAVDCQGVYRRSHLRLTLLQIGTSKGDVYLFDIQENMDLLSTSSLRSLLESEKIKKVMFKCSKDSGALYHSFQITLRNVFDIQDAHIILQEQKGRKLFPTLSLRDVCQVYTFTDKVSEDEEEIMKICAVESSRFWEERPLTDKMVSVAAGHVKALIPEVYGEQKRLIEKSKLNQKFEERVLESVKLHINTAVQRRRNDRINEHVMEILHSIDRTCTLNTKLLDFKEDSDELLALRIVDFGNVQGMSKQIQQLKNAHIDSYLDKIFCEVKSDQAESLVTSGKLRFLNKTRGHPDVLIARKAEHIKDEIQNIVLSSIERKYDVGTDVSLLSTSEQEILRDLPIWSDDDPTFSQLIKGLFWHLLENDLARKSDALHKYKGDYKLNKYFYYQMERFADCPSSDPVRKQVREKAKKFLDDIRLYEQDTILRSRDGGIEKKQHSAIN